MPHTLAPLTADAFTVDDSAVLLAFAPTVTFPEWTAGNSTICGPSNAIARISNYSATLSDGRTLNVKVEAYNDGRATCVHTATLTGGAR